MGMRGAGRGAHHLREEWGTVDEGGSVSNAWDRQYVEEQR